MRPSNSLKNKTPSDTYWKVQLVCKKVPAHSSLAPLEYNQAQMPLTNQGSLWPCSCRLTLEGKTGKEIPGSSTLEFLVKFSAKKFALSHAEDNTSRPLNRGSIADLPLSRTLLAIYQKSREPSFREVMDFFVLLAHASLGASRTLMQRLVACLNFTLESENLSFWYKRKT